MQTFDRKDQSSLGKVERIEKKKAKIEKQATKMMEKSFIKASVFSKVSEIFFS